ncbi:Uncharacterised protein [Corynebacterium jeikeium]|nr:Uncharacterised protein [Corynebacterium jeikeium]
MLPTLAVSVDNSYRLSHNTVLLLPYSDATSAPITHISAGQHALLTHFYPLYAVSERSLKAPISRLPHNLPLHSYFFQTENFFIRKH